GRVPFRRRRRGADRVHCRAHGEGSAASFLHAQGYRVRVHIRGGGTVSNDVIELDVIWDDLVEIATGFDNAGFNIVYRRELGEAEVNLGGGKYLIFQQTENRIIYEADADFWESDARRVAEAGL